MAARASGFRIQSTVTTRNLIDYAPPTSMRIMRVPENAPFNRNGGEQIGKPVAPPAGGQNICSACNHPRRTTRASNVTPKYFLTVDSVVSWRVVSPASLFWGKWECLSPTIGIICPTGPVLPFRNNHMTPGSENGQPSRNFSSP